MYIGFSHILSFIRFLSLKWQNTFKHDSDGWAYLNELWGMNILNIEFLCPILFTKWCWLDGTLELSGNINFQSTCKRATNYQLFLGSINKRFEVKSCNCEKPSRFSSFPFCPLDDAISFVELSVDIFKLSVYYTHLNNIYGVLKMYIYPKFRIHKNSKYRNISSESYDSPDLRQSVVKT